MRPIEFRGKRAAGYGDTTKWLFGGLWVDRDGDAHIVTKGADFEAVDTSTVGQYTGLVDRKNVKIFEGDIVHCQARLDSADLVVVFDEGCFRLILVKNYEDYVLSGRNHSRYVGGWHEICGWGARIEVLGNIHDNPELLSGGETP